MTTYKAYADSYHNNVESSIVAAAWGAGFRDLQGGTHGVTAYALIVNLNAAAQHPQSGEVQTPNVGYLNGPVFKIGRDGSIQRRDGRGVDTGRGSLQSSRWNPPGTDALNTIAAVPHALEPIRSRACNWHAQTQRCLVQGRYSGEMGRIRGMPGFGKDSPTSPNVPVGLLQQGLGVAGNMFKDEFSDESEVGGAVT